MLINLRVKKIERELWVKDYEKKWIDRKVKNELKSIQTLFVIKVSREVNLTE
jgi:hypothetical protein